MIINHNMSALNAHRNMNINNTAAGKSMEKLSSGLRINRAGDDAAGLAISEKMRGQIRGLTQASRNASDGISLIQTAEGALNETHNILQRMRELAVQSANDTNVDTDRQAIQSEMDALTEEINRISESTQFNNQNLLDGSFSAKFQIGANGGQNLKVEIGAMDAASLGLNSSSTANGKTTLTAATAGNNPKEVADGTYTVKGTDVFDEKGSIVGKIERNGNTSTLTFTGTKGTGQNDKDASISFTQNIKDGSSFTVTAGNPKNVEFEIEGSLNEKGQSLAAGNYEIKGAVVLRDGIEVGEFDAQGNKIKIKDAKGNAVEIEGTDLGLPQLDNGTKFSINGANVSTTDKASGTIETVNKAIEKVSTQRANLGAVQNRLEYTISNLDNTAENLTSAESTLRDVDMAKEMMEFSKNNILNQAAQAMISQANQQPQNVLQLLR
ncbi:flagellin [uncultured Clostridium sp.]|uniref:flagellin N-terminal helical domain-containing protein n=1 Tax=uncultured Clostridium sp. TaxID=59620 RepID=UPI0027DE48D2|nr:flagellin [uncultured Clostridium sp.]